MTIFHPASAVKASKNVLTDYQLPMVEFLRVKNVFFVMVTSYLLLLHLISFSFILSYLILSRASILSNHGACLIFLLYLWLWLSQ